MFMQTEEEKKKKKTADDIKSAPGRLWRFLSPENKGKPEKYVEGEEKRRKEEEEKKKKKPVEPSPTFLERLLGKKSASK